MARAIRIELLGDATGLSRALQGADRDVSGFGRSAVSTMSSFAGVAGAALAGVGAAAVAAGSLMVAGLDRLGEIQGTQRRFSIVFGEMAGSMTAFADSLNERMGLSLSDVQGLAAGVGDLLIPLGFSRAAAAAMTQQTVTMGAALSEWTGGTVSATGATEALTGAFLGEYDSLQSLGIAISAEDVAARLAAQGQDELTGASRKQAEAMAVQELVVESTTDAMAAYEQGQSPATEATNTLRASFQDLRDNALVSIEPLLTGIATYSAENMPAAMAATQEFIDNKLIPAFDSLKNWWTGEGGAAFRGAVGDAMGGVTDDMDGARESTQSFKDTMEDVTDVIEAGNKVAEVLNSVSEASGTAAEAINTGWRMMSVDLQRWVANTFSNIALTIIDSAASALSWIPGWGPKFEQARATVEAFRHNANTELDKVEKSLTVEANVDLARDEINKLVREFNGKRVTLQLAGYSTGGIQVGDGWGEPVGGGSVKIAGRMPPTGMGTAGQILGIARGAGVQATATSVYRPGAITNAGNPSLHGMGRAVDFAGGNLAAIASRLLSAGTAWRELIYTPLGFSIKNGRRVAPYAQADHYDHVHAALAAGGVFNRPTAGLFTLAETAGSRPEIVTPQRLMADTFRGVLGDAHGDIAAALDRQTATLVAVLRRIDQGVAAAGAGDGGSALAQSWATLRAAS